MFLLSALRLNTWSSLGLSLSAIATNVLLAGCGPELDPISRIETLRIIGVQKDLPFAKPGETVELSMLYEDTREGDAPVETFFAFWCVNPPGDNFGECLASPPSEDSQPQLVTGQTTFSLEIPDDILLPSSGPDLPDSGTAVVFFGVCSGKLQSVLLEEDGFDAASAGEVASGEALIPRCLDDEGKDVGPDDFLIGYSTVLVYEDLRNQNPILEGFVLGDEEMELDCIDLDCDGPFALPELDGCEPGVVCIEACEEDSDIELCPAIEVSAQVNPQSAEEDELAEVAYGTKLEESIWVSYFVDRGLVSPPLKLVNDAEAGFQSDYSTRLYAPKEPGPLRIWAAVRDNRGGVTWLRLPGYVKE